jgi:lysine N6-hydroxylase
VTGQLYDVLGVGAGPANLSLAALLAPVAGLDCLFLDGQPEFQWHRGLLLPGASLQVSFLKDLVTPVDPTSRYSFLSFLVRHRRLYRFVTAGFDRVSRAEFNQYLRWVAAQLPSVRFGCTVRAVDHRDGRFVVTARDTATSCQEVHIARTLVLGTGLVPQVPMCARSHLGPDVFHASDYLDRRPMRRARVAVIGGGQTGAEIVLDLLSDDQMSVLWASRRPNFLPLDETPFTNELFTPHYTETFFGLGADIRQQLLTEQRLASDGISAGLLSSLYQRLYARDLLTASAAPTLLLPRQELIGLSRIAANRWGLTLRHGLTGVTRTHYADVVILATGYGRDIPSYLDPLRQRLHERDGGLALDDNYRVQWDGHPGSQIYVQNAARHSHGIADPNLSLVAWRSAIIANSLLGKAIYDVTDGQPVLDWQLSAPALPPPNA